MASLGKIIIPISSALKTKYNTPENVGMFDADEDWLILWIQPEDYNVVNQYTAGDLNRGFALPTVLLKEKVYTFEVTVKEQRIGLYYLLQELIDNATSDPLQYNLITLHDHCIKNGLDDELIGYTVRNCIIGVEVIGFNFVGGETTQTKGIRLVCDEIK